MSSIQNQNLASRLNRLRRALLIPAASARSTGCCSHISSYCLLDTCESRTPFDSRESSVSTIRLASSPRAHVYENTISTYDSVDLLLRMQVDHLSTELHLHFLRLPAMHTSE